MPPSDQTLRTGPLSVYLAVYRTVCGCVQDSLWLCTGQSVAVYRTVCGCVQDSLWLCTGQPVAVGQGQEHQSISLTDTSVHLEMSPEMFPGMSSGMSLCDMRISHTTC